MVGGGITFVSTEGQGSAFTVRWPAKAPKQKRGLKPIVTR